MTEEWKPVIGYEGLYEVSNTGKVRSVDRTITTKNGRRKNLKGKELFFTISKIDERGHLPRASVQLWRNGKAVLKRVHRLVASAFIPNPDGKETVNHKDGNPLNNYADNLEWATHSENQLHAFRNGLVHSAKGRLPLNARKVRAFNITTGDEIVCDSCKQLSDRLHVCHQRVSECAAENENVGFSTCKGYVIQYL